MIDLINRMHIGILTLYLFTKCFAWYNMVMDQSGSVKCLMN